MPYRVSGRLPSSVDPLSETVSRFPEIAFSVLVLSLVVVRIVQGHSTFLHQPGSDWGVADWMTSYAAGFVRRGLGGSFLARLMRLTGLGFFPLLIAFTTAAYLAICLYLLRVSCSLRGPAVWRFALLLNPILIVSACDYGTISRKDVIFLFATLLNLWMGHRVLARQQEQPAARTPLTWLLLLPFAVLSLGLALLHEGIFAFIWLPLNSAIAACALARIRFSRTSALLFLAVSLLPSLAAVAASAYWHGDARTAEAICRSWRSSMPVSCDPGHHFPVALGAIRWSLHDGIFLSLSYARWFVLYPVIFALGGTIEIIAVKSLMPEARMEHLVSLLLFPFIVSLPLYLLGVDWGRWLSLVATGSLLPMLNPSLRSCAYDLLPTTLRNPFHDRFVPALDRAFSWLQPRLRRESLLLCTALLIVPIPPSPTAACSCSIRPSS